MRLSSDGRSLVGYVAGEPFPIIDANDPHAGDKVMWNETFRPISSDDYDLRWFDCDSEYWGKNASFRQIVDYEVGHYAGYNEVGRTEVDPIPIDPDFKKTGRYYLNLLYPVLAARRCARHRSHQVPLCRSELAMTMRGPGRRARGACDA